MEIMIITMARSRIIHTGTAIKTIFHDSKRENEVSLEGVVE